MSRNEAVEAFAQKAFLALKDVHMFTHGYGCKKDNDESCGLCIIRARVKGVLPDREQFSEIFGLGAEDWKNDI